MNTIMKVWTEFSEEDIRALDVELKVGVLATVNPQGLPHLTMLSSLRPYARKGLVWGQFTEGLSKTYIRQNPKVGWLVMSLDKQLLRGKADFSHTAKEGPEYENYNHLPMFRYNAYFGVHTVYYMDLVEHYGRKPLPMLGVVSAALGTLLARSLGSKTGGSQVLNPWIRGLFNKLDNLKFISYVGPDGYPLVLPLIQTQALNASQVIFSTGFYGQELKAIPPGVPMAVFGMSFDMEDVLLRGTYLGIKPVAGVPCGRVEIDWMYNPMPPVPQQIYPPMPIQAVKNFD